MLSDLSPENLLVEPLPRNTAPCIGWAAARLAERDPSSIVMVLPSDHHIANVEAFRTTLAHAVVTAAEGIITTIGITPSRPETGYGYIEIDEFSPAPAPLAKVVRRFVEKPSAARAEAFLASGGYLWNAGMFFFRAGDMVNAIRAHLPALAEGLDVLVRARRHGPAAEEEALLRVFPTLPNVSINHGVMSISHESQLSPGLLVGVISGAGRRHGSSPTRTRTAMRPRPRPSSSTPTTTTLLTFGRSRRNA